MLWINFLHLYQPANSDAYKIKEAVDLSYQRVVSALEKNPNTKFTLNISGCLVLRLSELKYSNLINRINKLIEKKQIELTGSAAYHPLLPLIKEEEVVCQIKENEKIMKEYFPKAVLRGFFLPEMAYGLKVAKIIKKLGYEWLVLDEISLGSKNILNFRDIYKDKGSGLKIIFRSREFSNCYVPDKLSIFIKKSKKEQNGKVIISATDGELYGLRHNDPSKKFENILTNSKIETILVSEYIKRKRTKEVKIRNSNWESTEKYLKNNEPYHLWYDRNNKVHLKLWEFVSLVDEIIVKYKNDDNHKWARWHFVRGLASCTFWWASGKDFEHNFGPTAWNPDEIERGANEFIRAVRSLEYSSKKSEKIKAELLFISIKKIIWTKHWSYHQSIK
ncbi:hypothetical protein CVU82_00625 [Candidatus Falkowbacteria bacterium HGW-Falkowbacteria-1]|jgi:predicted glycosyl hydrolase (DUF1957 family)|uniref:Glycoside hydrolase family 57 N-terminal domain-containing protein n=1 Tax=Candidatus Falkowbacteria bacterium HGW-Falkowbacteria-1 TaxID=2013768 RepID=A0A2N2EAE4_9BACT|nr:MAG: hypothetical protein CVU82_00625 [Candidatus Falkowbacteria bacterium HGW-Falkowbacteria-1]